MDLAKIKQRQALTGGDRWKIKDGANNVRLFFFKHKVTEADIKAGLYTRDKLGKIEVELDRPVVVHFNLVPGIKGPVRSTPALVQKFEQLKAAKGDAAVGKMAPSSMFAVNLVDMDEKPRKMRQVLINRTVYNGILSLVANKDYALDGVPGGKLIGLKGRDFVITYTKDAAPAARYSVVPRDRELCPVLNADLEKFVKDFMSPAGYAVLGIKDAPEEAEEEAPTEEEAPADEETPAEEETTEETPATEEEAPAEEETPAEEDAPAEEEEAPAPPPKKGAKPAPKGKPAKGRKEDRDD